MAPFNPYHKWLGIPPAEQPASYYRLLGIAEFEADPDVIDGAAEQRTIYLRTFQTGPNAEVAEGLLNEVSAARVCLLNAEDKSRYDQQLQVGAEHSRLKDVATATPERVIPRQAKSRPLANEDEVAVPVEPVEPVAAENSSTQERDWTFATVKLPNDKDRRLVEPEQLDPLDQDPLGYSPDELVPTADQATSGGRTPGKQEKPFWQEPWAIPAAGGGIVVLLLLMMLTSGGDPSSPGDKPELTDQQNDEQIQDALRAGREKTAAAQLATTQAKRKFDLLGMLKPSRDFLDSRIQLEKGVLSPKVLTPKWEGKNAIVMIPYKPVPEEYDIDIQLERKGDDRFGFDFGIVMGGRQAVISMDGSGKPAWCLHRIDGLSIHDDDNPTRKLGKRLHIGRRSGVTIRIRSGRVTVLLNAETIIDWKGRPEQFTLWDRLQLHDSKSLFFYSQAEFVVHEMTLTPVFSTSTGTPTAPAR